MVAVLTYTERPKWSPDQNGRSTILGGRPPFPTALRAAGKGGRPRATKKVGRPSSDP